MIARMGAAAWRRLWSSPSRHPWQGVAEQFRSYDRAVLMVRLFYASGLFLVYLDTAEWRGMLEARSLAGPWTLDWLPDDSVHRGVPWILGGYLATAILVTALPQLRLVRAANFVMLVQYVSLLQSFGYIRHTHHAWLWASGILVLLPNRNWSGRTTAEHRHYFLSTIWLAQLVVAAFYSLTGFWKVAGIGEALVRGEPSMLGGEGFMWVVVRGQILVEDPALLSGFLIDHPRVAWASYLATIYVELVAVVVAFRPRLHRIWGVLLIAFHFATELTMRISFVPAVVVVAVLFVGSPLAPGGVHLKESLLDLPGVFAFRRCRQRRA